VLLAEQFDGLVHIAARFRQGGFAFHHGKVGSFTQGFDVSRGYTHDIPRQKTFLMLWTTTKLLANNRLQISLVSI
jgi:hypothetical protein